MSGGVTSAAEMLEGRTLVNGWKVTERLIRRSKSTGGNFCVGYRVKHPDGREGFCKALDYAKVFSGGGDPATILQKLTENYNFERNILRKCGEFRMSRIVRMLDDGTIDVDGFPIPVSYIIFEYAQFDIRRELDEVEDLQAALRLRTLHHVAVGLGQLHGKHIVHQDLKPSNVLVVDPGTETRNSKLGDLGRATDRDVYTSHDDLPIAGDRNYAPPEQLYNSAPSDFEPRRIACDLYHLGSLATFLFTTSSMNALLARHLHPSHLWTSWTGTYGDVMPYIRDAFGRSLSDLRSTCPEPIAERLTTLVGYLCEPDPYLRGHPAERRQNPLNPYALQRIISEFNFLAMRADMRVRGKSV
jgi:serine/threonine protein kinase